MNLLLLLVIFVCGSIISANTEIASASDEVEELRNEFRSEMEKTKERF